MDSHTVYATILDPFLDFCENDENTVLRRQYHTLEGFRLSKNMFFAHSINQFPSFFYPVSHGLFEVIRGAHQKTINGFWTHFGRFQNPQIQHVNCQIRKGLQKTAPGQGPFPLKFVAVSGLMILYEKSCFGSAKNMKLH